MAAKARKRRRALSHRSNAVRAGSQHHLSALLETAVVRHRSGDLGQAERIYREILRQDPHHADALSLLGVLAQQAGRSGDAAKLIRRAIAVNPRQPSYHNNLGEVLRARGDLKGAEAAYRDALLRDPEFADARNNLGIVLREEGRIEEAATQLRRAIEIQPSLAEAHMNLGNCYERLGRLEEAVKAFEQAALFNPTFVEARVNSAHLQHRLGRSDDALARLLDALRLAPDTPELHVGLADVYASLSRHDEAVHHYKMALSLQPRCAAAYEGLGAVFMVQERFADAAEAFCEAAALQPTSARAYANLGDAYAELQAFRLAEEAQRKAVSLEPDNSGLRLQLARLLRIMGWFEESVIEARRATELEPMAPEAHDVLGTALQFQGNLKGAIAAFRRALDLKPDFAEALGNLGVALLMEGDSKTARSLVERSLELKPMLWGAYENLVTCSKLGPDDRELIRRMEDMIADRDIPRSGRVSLHFALGKAYQDLAQYEQAFEHYRKGNDLKRGMLRYSSDADSKHVRSIIATFDEDFIRAKSPLGDSTDVPIFIVGMPRSGTTLVEQILASHPQIHGAGELNYFNAATRRYQEIAGASAPYPGAAKDMDERIARLLTGEYLQRLCGGSGGARRVTDKMPSNFLHLGLMTTLFPNARVIHCRRDPMDVCLSNYFQNFAVGHEYAYDLGELGAYFNDYERVMAHWKSLLCGRMFEVRYEELVNEQASVSRELVAYCGLEWAEECLSYHKTERPVLTASQWQVRQPIYKTSVRRWKHYEAHLGDLAEALAEH